MNKDDRNTGTARLAMLGGLNVVREGTVVTGLRRGKVASLLAYLAYHAGHSFRREALAELLWPEMETELSNNSFRVALNRIRKILASLGLPDEEALVTDRTLVCLSPRYISTDAAEFEALLRQASLPGVEQGLDALERAAVLYLGPLLAGYEEDWVLPERQRLEDCYLDALQRLIQANLRLQEYDQALAFARRALPIDPYREEVHRNIIQVYLRIGRPSAARRQYQEMERLLRTELGITPSAPVRSLLKEIEQAENTHIAVPVHDAVRTSATALATLMEVPAHPLPSPITTFFGREEDLETVRETLQGRQIRCLTIIGPAGSGKTRLAQEAIRPPGDAFPGGIFWVPLESLTDPRQIAERIAASVALKLPPHSDLLAALTAALSDRQPTLLVLDNLEHLLGDENNAAAIVQSLVSTTGTISILATSRQQMGLSIEREYRLLPLAAPVPRSDARHQNLDYLLEFPAIRMFIDRVRLVSPTFTLTEQNAVAVVQLCYHLDGLPLAIELTAAWARTLTIPQILSRLHQRFDLFQSTTRDTPIRHRSLRSAVDWSYRLLSPELQRVFRALSVFQGGWTVSAAEEVAQTTDAIVCLHDLQSRSLVVAQERMGEMRFHYLETLREFAGNLLTDEEQLNCRRRHAAYFAAWIRELAPNLDKQNSGTVLDRMEAEYDNLRSALDFCLVDEISRESGLQIASVMSTYWKFRSSLHEGRRYVHALIRLPVADKANRIAKLKLLRLAGEFAEVQADYNESLALLEESLEVAQEIGDEREVQISLNSLGNTVWRIKGAVAARPYFERSVAMARRMGDPFFLTMPLLNLGESLLGNDDAAARTCFEEALAVSRERKFQRGIAGSLSCLAQVHARCKEFDVAESFFAESLQRLRDMGDVWGLGLVSTCYGTMLRKADRTEDAERVYRQALGIFLDAGSEPRIWSLLRVFAVLLGSRNPALSTLILGTAEAFRNLAEYEADTIDEAALRQTLCQELGEIRFHDAYRQGQQQDVKTTARAVMDFTKGRE